MNPESVNAYMQWGLRHYRQLITVISLMTLTVLTLQQSYDIYSESAYKKKLIEQNNIFNASTANDDKPLAKLSDFELLFGSSQRKDIQNTLSDIPKTQLNLSLHGALGNVKGSVKRDAYAKGSAIIQSNNTEKVYEVGDRLPGGATLSEVHSTYVVINRDGHLEKLAFPKPGHTASGINPVMPSRGPSHTSVNADYTLPSGSNSLEGQMKKLKDQLQKVE